jgi:hydroxyethylthiazole kinase-like uncharacterized protein yjeF
MLLANSQQIRQADQIQIEKLAMPGIILMETAGRLATEKLLAFFAEQDDFLILAGPGNNGGDGLAMARRLHLAGKRVGVLCSHDPARYRGDAKVNAEILAKLPVPVRLWKGPTDLDQDWEFTKAPVLVDALLGTGIESELRGPVREIIQHFQPQNLECVAVDLPSGLDANTGKVINQVLPARHTFTFQLPKICHYVTPAANFCGEVHVLDIEIWPEVVAQLGIEREVLDGDFFSRHYRPRQADSHKGSFGHLLLVGGSARMSGAITLAAMAAKKSGVGLATVFGPGSCRQTVLSRVPEAMCAAVGDMERKHLQAEDLVEMEPLLEGKKALVLGPGLGQHPDTAAFVEQLLTEVEIPMIIDADALNILARRPDLWAKLPASTILTPHPGEMSRLLNDPQCNQYRLESAEKLAQSKGMVVVLKGHRTIIALPDGRTYVNPTGNAGMASGGTGDVLAGMIGALLAQSYPAALAAPLAVWLHGLAGDRSLARLGAEGLTASALIEDLRF